MEDVTRELAHRQRIQSIYTKEREDFPSKDAYDDYLEAVEDIIYKLTYNIDVAEAEQQVQDYIRQQAVNGAKAAGSAGTYIPSAGAVVVQPQPVTAVQMDAEGRILPVDPGPMSRDKWQLMAQASGWSEELATQRALQDAFSTIFIF
eukprot:GHUV01006001.1.p2 GENE.GHUV01006001.1~~GHUV01006001.1.p2  ORF type:complete len:147 (+),score=35.72 GHUV01006001.1:228-668(+)